MDAQSVKNTDCAAVDTNGLPHALRITTANTSDKAGALEMLSKEKENLSRVTAVLCDGGYLGQPFTNAVKELIGAEVQIVKRSDLHSFKVLPKRCIVERSFAWLEKCRRLWKNCERYLHTSLQFFLLAFISLLLRRY